MCFSSVSMIPPIEHCVALQVFNPLCYTSDSYLGHANVASGSSKMKFWQFPNRIAFIKRTACFLEKKLQKWSFQEKICLSMMMKEKDWIVEGSSRACLINTNLPYSSLKLNFRYGSSGWEAAATTLWDVVCRPECLKTSPLEQFWANCEVFHLWLKLCHHSHYLMPVKNFIPHTCKHQEYVLKNWNALAPLKRKFTDSEQKDILLISSQLWIWCKSLRQTPDLKFRTFVGPIALQPNIKSKIKAHIITLVNATAKDELL